jgi:hypothetical protein
VRAAVTVAARPSAWAWLTAAVNAAALHWLQKGPPRALLAAASRRRARGRPPAAARRSQPARLGRAAAAARERGAQLRATAGWPRPRSPAARWQPRAGRPARAPSRRPRCRPARRPGRLHPAPQAPPPLTGYAATRGRCWRARGQARRSWRRRRAPRSGPAAACTAEHASDSETAKPGRGCQQLPARSMWHTQRPRCRMKRQRGPAGCQGCKLRPPRWALRAFWRTCCAQTKRKTADQCHGSQQASPAPLGRGRRPRATVRRAREAAAQAHGQRRGRRALAPDRSRLRALCRSLS